DTRIDVCPEPHREPAEALGYRRHRRNSKIRRYVEDPEPTAHLRVAQFQLRYPRILEGFDVDLRLGCPVVPPKCHGVTFDELQEALQNSVLQARAGRIAIGIRPHRGGTPTGV